MNQQRKRPEASRSDENRHGGLLLLCLLAAVLLCFGAAGIGIDPMPMRFGIGAASVLSGSMEPTLHKNDLVLVRAAEHYAPGEIVVWQDGRSLTVHRIVEINGEQLTTRGDANNTDDEPIACSAVRGRVIARIPLLGGALRSLKTPVGTWLLLGMALLLLGLPVRQERVFDAGEIEEIGNEIERLLSQQGNKEGHGNEQTR